MEASISFEFAQPENAISQRLQAYRLKNKFTDVTIKIGEGEFRAHRIVLEDASPVLKALLSDVWSKNDDLELKEEFIDPEIVEDLLSFFYTSKVTLTVENAHSLCIASHFLNISDLQLVCEKFLSERTSAANVLDLYNLSDKLELGVLRKSCVNCLLQNYEVAFKDPKLISFRVEDLQMIINDLNAGEWDLKLKEVMFESFISWVEHDFSKRSSSLPSLLKILPLYELSHRFLSEVVATQNIIVNSFSCSKLVLDAMSKVSINSGQASKNKNKLYCFGGENENTTPLSSASSFNFFTGEWSNLTPMSTAKTYFGGTAIGGKVYLCGGYTDTNVILNIMEAFDCVTNSWSSLPPMPEARYYCAAIAHEGFIYVSGGLNGAGSPLSTVVRYSIETNEWQSVKSMQTVRYSHQMIELNDHLYVIGGSELNTVEEYNPQTDVWTVAPPTKYKHSYSSAVSHKGNVFVFGNTGFEVYSPDSKTWSTLTSLQEYTGRTLISIKGKLWALGGGKDRATSEVFEFDPSTERWRQLPNMDIARRYHCAFAVNC